MNSQTRGPGLLAGRSVAIAGGGPAGLTLARLLQMRGVDVKLYELEAAPDNRDQGGALDLHPDSAQLALKAAGLFERFCELSRPEGQETKVIDKTGKVYIDIKPEDAKSVKPEIDRGDLRRMLYESLAPGTVTWSDRVIGVNRGDDGRLRLEGLDGTIATPHLIVGCDGTWSRVRHFITSERPRYAELTFVESRISDVDQRAPAVSALVGNGALMATSDNRGIIAQRNGHGRIRIYAMLRVAEDWVKTGGVDFADATATRAALLAHYEGWAPEIRALIEQTDDSFIPRPLYTHQPVQHWDSEPDVTLLGDAAHVMTPFTGRGVNLAMLDALELADALTAGGYASIDDALRAYEASMFARICALALVFAAAVLSTIGRYPQLEAEPAA